MTDNDQILVDGILDEMVELGDGTVTRDKAFERLAFEQILKDYDLSEDEFQQGWIDGSRDGGIDGFYVFVNGHLLQDPSSFYWPKSGAQLAVYIVTCKHHATFRQAALDKLAASADEIFDLGADDSEWKDKYSDRLLSVRRNLALAYRKLSPRLENFSLHFVYASRGNSLAVGTEVEAMARQVCAIGLRKFPSAVVNLEFIGATQIIELFRQKPNYELELKYTASLSQGERYVVLANLSDYYNFITDRGKLRRYLFDSNVRDFMGDNRVNSDIALSLNDLKPGRPDFWWLNNGVTILATAATIVGQSIKLSNIQIVNGLQTTECVFRYLSSKGQMADPRLILVKVIVTDDETIRDTIIRATNNQTNVELASLRATDKVQRDIEDILYRNGLYYERRKNFYVNQGIHQSEIVTPLYAGAGFLALSLKYPEAASTLKSKFMRREEIYGMIFDSGADLRIWPQIVRILKHVDRTIDAKRPHSVATDGFLKGWRYITSFMTLAKKFGSFDYSIKDLLSLDLAQVTTRDIEESYDFLYAYARTPNFRKFWTFRRNFLHACQDFSMRNNISGYSFISRRPYITVGDSYRNESLVEVEESLIERAKQVIPPQPWKPGAHHAVIERLGVDYKTYMRIVDVLVADGFLLNQRDGVLYDLDGNIVRFDEERVDPMTLQLRTKPSGLD